MGRHFLQTLNYSSVNEDWRTETAALRLSAEDLVLCVTGSGSRPLDLLAAAPARVVAVDLNPAQSHLLALKVQALLRLPFDQYVAFLGLSQADRRWRAEVLGRLGRDLPADACSFWQRHRRAVEAGVLYQGRWERHHRRLSVLARMLRPRAIRDLFTFEDLETQRRFLRERWDTPAWRRVHDLLCSPAFSRLFFRDPAFYAHVGVAVGRHVYERMLRCLSLCLARENFMVSSVLRGKLSPLDLPPHLRPEGCDALRGRLDRLEVVTDDLLRLLHRAPRRYTRFSLSDVPSFLDQAGFERLLEGVAQAALPGARFCVRQFLTRHRVPERFADRLVREPDLEARLAEQDHAFAYDFLVGEARYG
jgi:S-adenosylmethionine-diacylglycerol 3-amino-3-carboxypropyl transferase